MNALIQRLLSSQYVAGASSAAACDCWGLIEVWYMERFGITLRDRSNLEPGPMGVSAGFCANQDWSEVEQPRNDDLVVMRMRWNNETLDHGHVGVFWDGNVIHTSESHGPVCQSIEARQIKSRITCFLRHKSMQ